MDKIIINNEQSGVRIDTFLCEYYDDLSRSHIKNCLINGDILVNDSKIKAGYNLKVGDVITVNDIAPQEIDIKAQDIAFKAEGRAFIELTKYMISG